MTARMLALLLLGLMATPSPAETTYYRDPTLRGDTVVFTAEGDLWRVGAAGGRAQRLTSNAGLESQASLSPDGRWIAFVGSYDAMPEVYVMSIDGGSPRRLSFDGAGVRVQGWTPQGEVLYMSSAVVGPGSSVVLRAVDPAKLARRTLPFADANEGAFDDRGNVYFTRFGLHMTGDHARGYHGGSMAQLWRAPADGSAEALRLAADADASLSRPMWWNGALYFVSDESGSANLWRMDADGGNRQALTRFSDFEVRDPQMDNGRIVYQLGADIHLFDVASATDRILAIDLVSDFEQRRSRWIDKPLGYLESVSMAGDGQRAVLTARGAVIVAATDALRRVSLPVPDDVRIRAAVSSHDGKWVFALGEADGIDAIWRFHSDGSGSGEVLAAASDARVWRLFPSPDGKSIAFDDRSRRLSVLDIDSRRVRVIDSAPVGDDSAYSALTWSADSRYLAVSRPDSPEVRPQIVLLARDGSRQSVLTTDRYESRSPAFSRDGKWLYFLSDRSFTATPGEPWGDRNMGPVFDRRTQIYALALQEGNRFGFLPADELSPSSADKDAEDAGDGKSADRSSASKALPAIVWEGLQQRLFEVPLGAGNLTSLAADDKRLYFLDQGSDPDGHPALKTLTIDNKGDKPETFAADVASFQLSDDGKRLLLVKWSGQGAGDMLIVDAGAKAPEKLDASKLQVGDWKLAIDPAAEWQRIFVDAWRMHRQFSFDPGMRGVDWDAVRRRYEPLLDRVADRDELDDLVGQMTAELGILHSQQRGGDERQDNEVAQPAFLGAAFAPVAAGLRVEHIYRGDPELPGERAPLARPGTDLRDGDVITAINGQPVRSAADLSAALANQAGKQVLLAVQRGQTSLQRIALPVDARSESGLRYGDWEQRTRERAQTSSDGRIGYLHLRAMGARDIATFAREFYTNIFKDGLIIDVRRNNGGNIDSWIIEKLLRRTWAFWTYTDGTREWNMRQTFRGHLAVLIDEKTYSDGETFAAGIKALGLAPLIGQRTAGAGIWLSDRNRLVDGGMARVAEYPQFSAADGRWLIEGLGVVPDMAVVNPPLATFNGGDAQLDAAIHYLQGKLASEPLSAPDPRSIPERGVPAQDVR